MINFCPTPGKTGTGAPIYLMKTYAVKVQNGKATVYDAQTGVQLRVLSSKAVSAQITGDQLQVTTSDGHVEIYSTATWVLQRIL